MANDRQRFLIQGRVYLADDGALQQVLSALHDSTGQRPRCLCRGDGVEMYVAWHGRYLVKRMPGTGDRHHPQCPSFEPLAAQSGLGELVGDAVKETEPGRVELRVDFPWVRVPGHRRPRADNDAAPGEVGAIHQRMSLRAVMHYLFEQAGFNRWTPAMAGKRSQAVVQKYLLQAAGGIYVKGLNLAERLYVPEPFSEAARQAAAARRREKLAVLRQRRDAHPLAMVVGEFKQADSAGDTRVWIKHMPDTPLWAERRTWERLLRTFAPLVEAHGADSGVRSRLVLGALIQARNEFAYGIDLASLMLVSEQWIPVDGVHELPLIHALVEQGRRFVKPLRYDARVAGRFPNVLLLDCGLQPVPLHVMSPFLPARERDAKREATAGQPCWIWQTDQPMPPFPPASEA